MTAKHSCLVSGLVLVSIQTMIIVLKVIEQGYVFVMLMILINISTMAAMIKKRSPFKMI